MSRTVERFRNVGQAFQPVNSQAGKPDLHAGVNKPNPMKAFFKALKPRKVRTFRQFAEQEIILPRGPRKGLRFRCDYMPWTGLVLDEFTRGHYRRFFGSGPAQSSKTLIFFVIPVLYHLFEGKEDVIIGVPNIDMAQEIYKDRLHPALIRTRYAHHLPEKGAGSRGGKFTSINFTNGSMLRFMGAGGGDEQRSSHNARIIILTEIDKMDVSGVSSREADPVTQIETRARAFGKRARVYGECTMSIESGRINREINKIGTGSKIYIQCPHCKQFSTPDREHFIGYQDAPDILTAADNAQYICQECGTHWIEQDRMEALKTPIIIASGQTIEIRNEECGMRNDGKSGMISDSPSFLIPNSSFHISGLPPRTNTYGLTWNSMHSALTEMSDISEIEFRAKKSGLPEDMKAVMQFVWALPYQGRLLDMSEISIEMVLEHIKYSNYDSGRIKRMPFLFDPKKICVTGGVDIHKKWLCAVFDAWEVDAQGCVLQSWRIDNLLDYEYPNPDNPDAIYRALEHVRSYLMQGWKDSEGKEFHVLAVAIDSGYQSTKRKKVRIVAGADYQVYDFVKTYGQKTWRAIKGEQEWETVTQAKMLERRKIWLWHLDTDILKCEIHDQVRIKPGQPGFFHLPQNIQRQYARGLCAEKRIVDFDKRNREQAEWVKEDPYNHPLDATVYSWAMARAEGVRPPRT